MLEQEGQHRRVERLRLLDRILKMPDVKQRYDDLGIMPLHSTPERMLETIRAEIPQMAKVLAAVGLKPE